MKLYFSPFSCSMATRISLYERGAQADFVQVDAKTKRTVDGEDFSQVNPLGYVPTLRLDDGEVLTENAAILQHVAGNDFTPTERMRLQQWLSFIGAELHKTVFTPILSKTAPAEVKAYALSLADARLSHVAAHLANREYLLDRYTVADAYLFVVLNWATVTPIKLAKWPALTAFAARMHARPAVARAFGEERALYAATMR